MTFPGFGRCELQVVFTKFRLHSGANVLDLLTLRLALLCHVIVASLAMQHSDWLKPLAVEPSDWLRPEIIFQFFTWMTVVQFMVYKRFYYSGVDAFEAYVSSKRIQVKYRNLPSKRPL